MDFSLLSIQEIRNGIVEKKWSSVEVVNFFIKKCRKFKHLNAIIEVFDDCIDIAKNIDQKIARGEKVGKLAGIPVVIKDNIFYKGHKCSCASLFMQDYIAPYSATVVDKLLKEDAVIFARSNMDEFAMGGSNEKSCYGPCYNAINSEYVSGGSSGGSAVAVAAGLTPIALGTDTGGSIRQPASFNGIVGIKPTYGAVSRFGVVAFASSLDQVSPLCKTVDDCKYVFDIISGKDCKDLTTINLEKNVKYNKNIKIGLCRQVFDDYKKLGREEYFVSTIEKLSNHFNFVWVDIKHIANALACYYIIAPAEASSNLSRFDAVRYGKRDLSAQSLNNLYINSRTKYFGKEVKRRIMLGNFVLSSGYYDEYYNKAKKIQSLIRNEFDNAFDMCDCIIMPTTPYTAFKIGEKTSDPVTMYLEDLFTVPANISGIPSISIPYAIAENGLPLGLQVLAKRKNDKLVFDVAKQIQKFLEV